MINGKTIMDEEKKKFKQSIKIPLIFIGIIWLVKIVEVSAGISFVQFGLLPREPVGLIGIITAPLIHSGFVHLISNTFPLFILGTALYYFYPESAGRVAILVYLLSNIIVWFIGRESYHIGASGVVYGLVTFTFFSGVIRWDRRSIVLSLIITFLYGSYTWGVLPTDPKVSWESHLSGAVIGFICAIIFKNKDPYEKFAGMDDEEDELEINNL